MNYASAEDFRRALQDRLRNEAQKHPSIRIERLRKRIAFERFLARLQVTSSDAWVIKGGMALEMRFDDRARMTKDLDLATPADATAVLAILQTAAELDLRDQFAFQIDVVEAWLLDEGERTLRTRLRSFLANQRFEFAGLDVGLEKALPRDLVIVKGSTLLEFAGVEPIRIPALPLEFHLAEKLHACMRIYADGRPSSRVKDLVDIVLIVTETSFESSPLLSAIESTFQSRQTQPIPIRFPPPPDFWERGFQEMATEVGLDPDIESGYRVAAAFFDPVLNGSVAGDAVWSPDERRWNL